MDDTGKRSGSHRTHKRLLSDVFRTSVTVIGAGGTGSHMVHGLAMLDSGLRGIGHPGLFVTLWDQDAVEEHNVGRQRFAWNDIGRNKAHALIEQVNTAYCLDWKAMPTRMEPFKQKSIGNIAITCVDTGKFRNDFQKVFKTLTAKASLRELQEEHEGMNAAHYWMDIGNGKDFGQIILGGEGLPTCVDLFGKYPKDEKGTPTCSMADSLKHQDLFINQLVSAHALNLLWSMFRKGVVKRPQVYVNINQDRYAVRATKMKSHEAISTGQKAHLHAQGKHRPRNVR